MKGFDLHRMVPVLQHLQESDVNRQYKQRTLTKRTHKIKSNKINQKPFHRNIKKPATQVSLSHLHHMRTDLNKKKNQQFQVSQLIWSQSQRNLQTPPSPRWQLKPKKHLYKYRSNQSQPGQLSLNSPTNRIVCDIRYHHPPRTTRRLI